MKRELIAGFVISILAMVVIACAFCFPRTSFPADASVAIQFETNGTLEQHTLRADEAREIVAILNACREHPENYSFGFSDKSAILINGVKLYLAWDACGIVKDSSSGRFFSISKEDKHRIADIFAEYGGVVRW